MNVNDTLLKTLESFDPYSTIYIKTRDMTIHSGPGFFTYRSDNKISEESKKILWHLYQTYIYKKKEDEAISPAERVLKIEKLVTNYIPHFKATQIKLNDLEKEPQQYLEVAIHLHNIIKEIFFSSVDKKQKLKITHHCFQENLDTASSINQRIFEDLFIYYFGNNQFDEAYQTAKKLRFSQQGTQNLLMLALVYLRDANIDKMIFILNSLDANQVTDKNIKEFLERIQNLDSTSSHLSNLFPILALSIDQIKDDKVKAKIIFEMIDWYLNRQNFDEALDLIKKLDSSTIRDEKCYKFIAHYTSQGNIPSTIEAIKLLSKTDLQQIEYEKLRMMLANAS